LQDGERRGVELRAMRRAPAYTASGAELDANYTTDNEASAVTGRWSHLSSTTVRRASGSAV